jgi:hypothetical protein
MILMKTGMHYEPAAIYLVCVLYGPSRPVCPTNIRRSHRADEGQLWVESGGRASQAIYCASVSPSVRCVATIVRRTPTSVSDNVRRKWPSIARRTVHHCARLHVAAPSRCR